MTFDNIYVRRVAPSEVERIKAIQEDNKNSIYHEWLWKHYNKHDLWLNDVIEEIKEGKRIALAAWGSYYVDRNWDEKESCFLASIILKQPQFIDYKLGELKNLIIDENQIRKIIISQNPVSLGEVRAKESFIDSAVNEVVVKVWTRIIEKVETYCKRRSFKELYIEVPAENVTLINSFLNNEFIVKDSKPSQYVPGKSLYVLSKSIPSYYAEDPFCLEEMAKWIVSTYYNCILSDEPFESLQPGLFDSNLSYMTDYISYVNFTKTPEKIDSSAANVNLKGRVYVFKNYDLEGDKSRKTLNEYTTDVSRILDLLPTNTNIVIFLSYYNCEYFKVECARRGIVYFSREEHKSIFGEESLAKTIPFDRKQLAGIIFVEDDKFREKIKNFQNRPFVYILNGSTGRYADEVWGEIEDLASITPQDCGINENADLRKNIALFFSPFVNEKDSGVIWGFSVIEGVRYGKKAINFNYNFEGFDHYDNIESEDFKRLIRFNENGAVVSFLLSPPCLLYDDSLIEVQDICGPVTKPAIRGYLDDLSVSNIYINSNMKVRFLKLAKEKEMRKSIFQSLRLAMEVAKATPPGQMILGPMLRLYDEEKHDELVKRLDDLYLEVGKIKEENIGNIFEDVDIESEKIQAIVEMLNNLIKTIERKEPESLSGDDVKDLLSKPILPIKDYLLIDELEKEYCRANDFEGFQKALMRGDFVLPSTSDCRMAVTIFAKKLHSGKSLESVILCFEDFANHNPESKIFNLCLEYFKSLAEV